MAIVSKPDGQMYPVQYSDDQSNVQNVRGSSRKMFPKKEDRTRDDAAAVAKAGSTGGDVQAYSNQ